MSSVEGSLIARVDLKLMQNALPRITFRGLRYSHAIQMLVEGVPMKMPSERLGHSGIAITMDIYLHVLPGARKEAVAKVDRALQAAVNSRSQST